MIYMFNVGHGVAVAIAQVVPCYIKLAYEKDVIDCILCVYDRGAHSFVDICANFVDLCVDTLGSLV